MVSIAAGAIGCGGDESENAALAGAAAGQRSTSLAWALAERPRTLDPLYVTSAADLLVSRQLHEPLVESLGGPFDFRPRLPGLALSVEPSADQTVWRARLRQGVRFQDGAPFNAAAVLANVDRWQTSPVGREALGELLVDAPRPDLVRFILPAPDSEFDRRLAAPELGIVSPRALAKAGGGELDPSRLPQSGTGPFELRERGAHALVLARNTEWWGTDHGLGPGVDQIEMRIVTDPGERLGLLRDGTVQVADLARGQRAAVRADPLLTTIERPGHPLGVERSVRGIPADESAPSLNSVWLTGIDSG